MNPNNHDNSILPAQLSLHNTTSNTGAVNYLSENEISLPPSLSNDDSIEVLGLPIRLENALKNSGNITTVGQLVNTADEKLLKLRNLGHKSVNYLMQVKLKIDEKFSTLQNRTPTEITEQKQEEKIIPVNQLLNLLLDRCGSERVKEIVKRRYGLMDGERQTLEEIGEHYGVTRERIRQIQVKALKSMRHPITTARKPITDIMETILFRNGGIISAEEADTIIPEAFSDTGNDGSSVLDLLCELGWIQSCRIGDIAIYSPKFDGVSLCKLSEKITFLIKKQDLGIDIPSIFKGVSMFRRIRDQRFNPQDFVLRYCRIDPRIEEIGLTSAQPEVFFRYYTVGHFAKKGWVVLMTRVLEQEQMPLHFTEIADKVNDLLGNSERRLDVRRAHSILIDDEAFAHSGINGTYGLTSWGLRKDSTVELAEECLRKAGFPLHWKQIFNYVSRYKNTKPGNITSILENHRRFKRVESGIYWLND